MTRIALLPAGAQQWQQAVAASQTARSSKYSSEENRSVCQLETALWAKGEGRAELRITEGGDFAFINNPSFPTTQNYMDLEDTINKEPVLWFHQIWAMSL